MYFNEEFLSATYRWLDIATLQEALFVPCELPCIV